MKKSIALITGLRYYDYDAELSCIHLRTKICFVSQILFETAGLIRKLHEVKGK